MKNREPGSLRRVDLSPDPLDQFATWFAEAEKEGLPYPPAAILATADAGGRPSQRSVLLRKWDGDGFVFFTSSESKKAREMAENAHVSLLMPWLGLQRQVMVAGTSVLISREETGRFFETQPRESQLSTWVSVQCGTLESRGVLESEWKVIEEKFKGVPIPLPPHWNGFRVTPDTVEFWQAGARRLNDRFRYSRNADRGGWSLERMVP